MSGLDIIAGFILGAFLLAVAWHGNSGSLLDNAKRDVGFLKWAIALGALWYLYRIPGMSPIVTMLIFAAFIGLGLKAGPQISAGASQLWAQLGGKKSGQGLMTA